MIVSVSNSSGASAFFPSRPRDPVGSGGETNRGMDADLVRMKFKKALNVFI
jgi:hypothetical protein